MRFKWGRLRARWLLRKTPLLAALLLWGFLILNWWSCNMWPLLSNVDPSSAAGQAGLKVIANKSAPLLSALERYHRAHGAYPDHLSSLDPADLTGSTDNIRGSTWNDWAYYPGTPQKVSLVTKLSVDPLLSCEVTPAEDVWIYDPGDGSGRTTLPFHIR